MPFAQLQWSSDALQKMVGLNVILPSVGEPPYPTFYLLHGLSDDYTAWHRRTRIEWYAREYPFIIVMPDGYRGFYTRNEAGPDYDTYMARELPAFVERYFQASPQGDRRCIGGLSMGGYGALRLALAYPDVFGSVTSHSGAVLNGTRPNAISSLNSEEMRRIFGDNPQGTQHDIVHLARRALGIGSLPAIRLDCGEDDFLIEHNRVLHEAFSTLGVEHEYQEYPGSHSWDYWDLRIQEALAWHAARLGYV